MRASKEKSTREEATKEKASKEKAPREKPAREKSIKEKPRIEVDQVNPLKQKRSREGKQPAVRSRALPTPPTHPCRILFFCAG